MNPLEHFGIKKQFIRGDTTSYNMRCPECGKHLTEDDAYGHDCEAKVNRHEGPVENLTEKGLQKERETERLHRKKHSSYY